MVVGCQPYAPAAFTPRKSFWYSFLLEADLTQGHSAIGRIGTEPATFRFVAQHLNHCAAAVPNKTLLPELKNK